MTLPTYCNHVSQFGAKTMQTIEKKPPLGVIFKLSAALGVFALLFLSVATLAQPSANNDDDIIVFAASSLAPLMETLSARYNEAHVGKMRMAYGASGGLARQIAAGAPAHIFITADHSWLDWLARRGQPLVQTTPFARNSLVLAYWPSDDLPSNPGIADILNASATARIGIGSPNSVPVGHYAKEALQNMQLWNSIKGRIAPVGSASALGRMLRLKAVPIGVIFASETIDGMETLSIPPQTHSPIVYIIGTTPQGNTAKAKAAIEFLLSEPALALAQEMGFDTNVMMTAAEK